MGCSQSLAQAVVSSDRDSIQPPSPGQCLQVSSLLKIYFFESAININTSDRKSHLHKRYSDTLISIVINGLKD